MLLPITLTISAAAAILNIWLGLRCARVRAAKKIFLGSGDDPTMLAKMRAQANFVEYTLFVLILLALLEHAIGSKTWLWAAGIAYLLGRIVHVFGLDRPGLNWMRGVGIGVTIVVTLALAAYAIYLPYAVLGI
ncbi:MAG TPA: MAPEG family protein [Sphingomonas sp.]|nr:MAPEG family protein [Sphingomonas sp.]